MDLLPKKPAKVRKTTKVGRFGLKAVGICRRVNIAKQVKYRTFLPNVSDNGARIRGPIPSMMTKPVWQAITESVGTPRESAILSIPGANMLLAKGLRTN
jgi:hypothetical protein